MHKTLLIITLLITHSLFSMDSMHQLSKALEFKKPMQLIQFPSLQELCSKKVLTMTRKYVKQELHTKSIDWKAEETEAKVKEFLGSIPTNLMAKMIPHAQEIDISKEPTLEPSLNGLCYVDKDHTRFVTIERSHSESMDTKTLISVLGENNNITTSIPIEAFVHKAVLAPNQDYVATADFKNIAVYAIKSKPLQIATTHLGISGDIYDLLFFHDTLLIADFDGIRIWNFLENKPPIPFVTYRGLHKKMCLLNDNIVFTNDNEKPTINIVTDTGFIKKTLYGHTRTIKDISSHPATNKLASAGEYDYTVRVWDTKKDPEDACIAILPHEFGVESVAFDPSGNNVITGTNGQDHTVYLWNIESKTNTKRIQLEDYPPITFLSWSKNSIIAKNGRIDVYAWKPQRTELGKILETMVEEQTNLQQRSKRLP